MFDKGIFFSCQKCGSCCSYLKGFGTQLFYNDILKISDYLKVSIKSFITNYCLLSINEFCFLDISLFIDYIELNFRKNKLCPFLKNKLCSIQEVKPHTCKQGPFISSLISNEYFWKLNKQRCSGIGQGDFFSGESIKKICGIDDEAHDLYEKQLKRFSNVREMFSLENISIPQVFRKYNYNISYEKMASGDIGSCDIFEEYKT